MSDEIEAEVDETDETEDGPEQWSPAAREAVAARAEAVRAAMTRYLEAVLPLTGRQRELDDLFTAR